MNFADQLKHKPPTEREKREMAVNIMENWKKPISPQMLSEAIRKACMDMSQEMNDALPMLIGLAITMTVTDELFPEEERKEEIEKRLKEKGEK